MHVAAVSPGGGGASPLATPGGFRGPFARWPRAADAGLCLVMLAAASFLQEGPGDSVELQSVSDVPVGVLVLYAVASAALYLRRSTPLPVLGIVLVAWALTLGSGHSDLGGHAILGLYATGRYAREVRWGQLGVAGAVTVLVADGLTVSEPWAGTAFGVVVMFTAWYVGRRLRLRVERSQELVREQRAEARRIVNEERTRIARELHDVVAHRVGLMTVQAGAARTVAGDDPEAALRAMAAVEEAGRQALDELRHLLGVLRDDDQPGTVGPQPSLSDLPRLVEQTRQAGLDVSCTTGAVPAGLPARLELSAYRIVQESLTNVVKHAGPAARTRVRVAADGRWLVIDVSDDGLGASGLPGAGHGIVGMRERASLLGGTLVVGPREGGGFGVHARLPIDGAPA